MRRVIALLILLSLALPSWAQAPVGDEDRAAIRWAIEGQIAAFRRDDAEGAFAFASPSIRRIFGTSAVFADMVRRNYPQVYQPDLVAFGDLFQNEGRIVQLVGLVDADGRTIAAAYEMVQQQDGVWRINGCQLLDAPQRAS